MAACEQPQRSARSAVDQPPCGVFLLALSTASTVSIRRVVGRLCRGCILAGAAVGILFFALGRFIFGSL